jgi:hypothetical protein
MTRPGDVDQPTKEWPSYQPGRAEPGKPPEQPAEDPIPDPAPESRRRPFRTLMTLGVVLAVAVTLLAGARLLLPSFDNPFGSQRTDRSQPVLLQSVRDLSRFVGADGTFQVVVDVQDKRDNIPAFLLNRRTLFVAAGTVEAYVDFSRIGEGAVKVSDDGKTATVTLPAPELSKAALDMEKSYVFAEESGALNRLKDLVDPDPGRQQEVYKLGEQRITEAAAGAGLGQRAQDNTRKMLEQLLKSLGYQTVTVTFDQP